MGMERTVHKQTTPTVKRKTSGRWLLTFVVCCDLVLAVGVVKTRIPQAQPGPRTAISIAIGSEDLNLFTDQQVQNDFAAHGYAVSVTGFGSFTIASDVSAAKYTLALPSSTVTTDALRSKVGEQQPTAPLFTTPLVVLTWKPLIPLLQSLGIATSNTDGTWTFHLARYVAIADEGVKWSSIAGNNFYPNPNQVQLQMTNPAESNSGAMFVAAAGFALNNDQVVSSAAQITAVAGKLAPVFRSLGEMQDTTDHLFDDYCNEGEGGAPLVLSYESEYVGAMLTNPAVLPPGAMMMYTDPAVDSDHTLLSLDGSTGSAFLNFIAGDRTFQQIAESDFGFRTGPRFVHDMSLRGITVATELSPAPTPLLANLKELINEATDATGTAGSGGAGTP